MDNVESKIHADVKEYGWHLIGVLEDSEGPSFAYSIGLQKTFGHSEILILGLDIKIMHQMINGMANRVKVGVQFVCGQRDPGILAGYDCLIGEVEAKFFKSYLGRAIDFYGGYNFQALQCLWPDRHGLFPSDPHFSESLQKKQALMEI